MKSSIVVEVIILLTTGIYKLVYVFFLSQALAASISVKYFISILAIDAAASRKLNIYEMRLSL